MHLPVRQTASIFTVASILIALILTGAAVSNPVNSCEECKCMQPTWENTYTKVKSAVVVVSATKTFKTLGAGFVVDKRGYVLTARHVVKFAKKVRIRTDDETEHEAEVTAADPTVDLALLHASFPKCVTVLKIVKTAPKVCSEVLAIGHPHGLTWSVSTGIVSAVGRELSLDNGTDLRDLIQTTAAINPGNSGGPLLNRRGQVVGLNVAYYDGATGIGFAVSYSTIHAFLKKHLPTEK